MNLCIVYQVKTINTLEQGRLKSIALFAMVATPMAMLYQVGLASSLKAMITISVQEWWSLLCRCPSSKSCSSLVGCSYVASTFVGTWSPIQRDPIHGQPYRGSPYNYVGLPKQMIFIFTKGFPYPGTPSPYFHMIPKNSESSLFGWKLTSSGMRMSTTPTQFWPTALPSI